MFETLVVLQVLCIAILFFTIIYIFNKKPSKEQLYLLLSAILFMLTGFGYLIELLTDVKEVALIGVKIGYFGKCYMELTLFLFVLKYTNSKFSRNILDILFIFHTFTLMLVCSCEFNKLFYKKIIYVKDGLFPHLKFSHGPIFYAHVICMFIYISLMCYFSIKAYFENTNDKYRKRFLYLAFMWILPGVGYLVNLSFSYFGYDFTHLGYLAADILFMDFIFRYKLFDALQIAKENIIEKLNDAVIVLDANNKILYENVMSLVLFKDFLNRNTRILPKEFLPFVEEKVHIYETNNKIYEVKIEGIYVNEVLYGKVISFTDVTKLKLYADNLEELVNKKTVQIENIQKQVIISFAAMIESRDGITGQHVKRTSDYVNILGKKAKEKGVYSDIITNDYIELITNAAPMHDIGKINISDNILKKNSKLTKDEYDVIKTHTTIGGLILGEVLKEIEQDNFLLIARDMALFHHERWDGRGYPEKLKGEQIPVCARIMAIADVFDALTSRRSYKKPIGFDEAFTIIKNSAGSHFDPVLVDAFMECRDEIVKAGI